MKFKELDTAFRNGKPVTIIRYDESDKTYLIRNEIGESEWVSKRCLTPFDTTIVLRNKIQTVISKLKEKRFSQNLSYPAMAAFDISIGLLEDILK